MSELTKFEGTISGSVANNGRFFLEVEDHKSGTTIVRVEMDSANLGKLIAGYQSQPCEGTISPPPALARVGRFLQVKSLIYEVTAPERYQINSDFHGVRKDDNARLDFVAQFERLLMDVATEQGFPPSDGWEVFSSGLSSRQDGKGWNFSIRRWTEKPNEFTKGRQKIHV